MHTTKIYGPPGTGKTYTLLNLFQEELQTIKPNRIGFCTFTRAARLEALERTGMTEDDLPYVKTLHAICYRLLGIRHDQLVSPKHLKEFGKKMNVKLTGYMPDVFSLDAVTEGGGFFQPTKADRLLQLNHLGRHRGIHLKEALRDAPADLDFNYSKWFTESYRKWKNEEGLLDYTDLLTEYLARGPDLDVDVFFVDEAQDLSHLQWKVVHKLGRNAERRYLAGDDDQAIFVWAGASAEMFNTEPANLVRVLPQSHRIARAIHDVSQHIITRVKVRQPKEFKPRDSPGIFQEVGYLDTKWLGEGSTLVLFRNHHRGLALAGQLEELGIPFKGSHSIISTDNVKYGLSGWKKIEAGEDLNQSEAKAILELVPGGLIQEGAKERVNTRMERFPAVSLLTNEALQSPWNRVLCRMNKLRYVERLVNKYGFDGALKPTISLLSIHQSKGREADTVVLDLELARRTYEAYMNNPDDEHRVYYVGVTRAREQLYALMPTDPMSYQL